MYDVILAGGGLANGLLAWRLRHQHPDLKLLLIEQGSTLGGQHTWSFYHQDLTQEQRDFLTPIIAHVWPAYSVKFPEYERTLDIPYYSVTSENFHVVLMSILHDAVLLNTTIDSISSNSVTVQNKVFTAPLVIDGRGHVPSSVMHYAYQKFMGLIVRLAEPHTEAHPVIMDATVQQEDGFRFVYTLPLDTHRILIEDTYYSDTDQLDVHRLEQNIYAYAAAKNWVIAEVIKQEKGVLPITLSGDIDAFWCNKQSDDIVYTGLRANLFHQTTGYSLLYAMRLADEIIAMNKLDTFNVTKTAQDFSRQIWQQQSFMRILNRMLFFAAQPGHRYRLLARFYRLPQALIERFYAGHLSWKDKLRLISGKPPVSVFKAIRAILNRQAV